MLLLLAAAMAAAFAQRAEAAIDIDATFSEGSLGDWTGVNLPNPEGDTKEEAFTLMEDGPLGTHFARLLLDSGWKVGQSGGERVSLVGHWGVAPVNDEYATDLRDAADGTEYWYLEAFRIPAGFEFGPDFTIVSEWHGNSAFNSRPIYNQAPWKFNLRPHDGTLFFNVFINTGKQFGNGVNAWEINGWNPDWSSTEPSDEVRTPRGAEPGSAQPEGEPLWLAPVAFDRWQYFLYRIRWRNDWTGIFECWTRTEDEEAWTKVANYRDFPTRVYQDGDEQANLYAIGNYYRGNGGTRQHVDYGGRLRSNAVADAEQGTESAGFRELAGLARFPTPPEAVEDEPEAVEEDDEEPAAAVAASPGDEEGRSWLLIAALAVVALALLSALAVSRRRRAARSQDGLPPPGS